MVLFNKQYVIQKGTTMGYYSDLSIDTRTCGQADEDARLDRRDGIVTRQRTFDAMAAQRWLCDQAGRERPTAEYLANVLERAGELAQAGRLRQSAAQHRKFVTEVQG